MKMTANSIYEKINPKSKERMDKAYAALLAYEKNCAKYEKHFDGRPTYIPKGERMIDFACKFGTTIEEMKDDYTQNLVEQQLNEDFYQK